MTQVKLRRGAGNEVDGEAAAAAPVLQRVTDGRGRVLCLRRPSPLAQFRLVRMLEPEAARNGAYVDMLFQLLFVAEVDGAPIGFPQGERELEALVLRLGDDGLEALGAAIEAHFGAAAEPDRDAIKN